jgi:membrane protease YdiL (CAAX protease family)
MSSILDEFPLALMAIVLLIPLAYCAVWRKTSLRKAAAIWLLGLIIVLLYPIVTYAFEHAGDLGYFLAKLAIFVLLPIGILAILEKWTPGTVLMRVGVRRENMGRSILYGLIAAAITIAVTMIISTTTSVDLVSDTILFLDAFTEEFLFRGVLFLYLMTLIDWRVAFGTSVLAFVLVHPQNFTNLFIISTIVQALLLTWVAFKTENIIGCWISHGLNRIVPQMIRVGLGI